MGRGGGREVGRRREGDGKRGREGDGKCSLCCHFYQVTEGHFDPPPHSDGLVGSADVDRGRISADNDRGTPLLTPPPPTRTRVDFSSAQRKSKEMRAARKIRKRGRVCI